MPISVIGWKLLAGGTSLLALQVGQRWRQSGISRPEKTLKQRSTSIGSWKSLWHIVRCELVPGYRGRAPTSATPRLSLPSFSLSLYCHQLRGFIFLSWSGEASILYPCFSREFCWGLTFSKLSERPRLLDYQSQRIKGLLGFLSIIFSYGTMNTEQTICINV